MAVRVNDPKTGPLTQGKHFGQPPVDTTPPFVQAHGRVDWPHPATGDPRCDVFMGRSGRQPDTLDDLQHGRFVLAGAVATGHSQHLCREVS